MSEASAKYYANTVRQRILTIRNQKVILDSDLAHIYGVEVKRLNEQVKRNSNRFPSDFLFQLTTQETAYLRSQFATSSTQIIDNKDIDAGKQKAGTSKSSFSALKLNDDMRSPIVIGSTYGGRRYLPFAFTEHGAIMAASILNSPQAVEMSVFVVRAFIKMREQMLATATLAQRLAEVEKTLLTHDTALRDLYQKIRPLLLPPPAPDRKPIGFSVRESRAAYRSKRKSAP